MSPLILVTVLGLQTTGQPPAETLFTRLDRNHDQQITADELSPSQETFFRRALRVADRNEDGVLSESELNAATQSPKPVVLPSGPPGGRGGLPGQLTADNLTSRDRNKDGELTLDEIPAPLKPRFEEFLRRLGRSSLPVDRIEQFLQRTGLNSAERPMEQTEKQGGRMEMEFDGPTAAKGASQKAKPRSEIRDGAASEPRSEQSGQSQNTGVRKKR